MRAGTAFRLKRFEDGEFKKGRWGFGCDTSLCVSRVMGE